MECFIWPEFKVIKILIVLIMCDSLWQQTVMIFLTHIGWRELHDLVWLTVTYISGLWGQVTITTDSFRIFTLCDWLCVCAQGQEKLVSLAVIYLVNTCLRLTKEMSCGHVMWPGLAGILCEQWHGRSVERIVKLAAKYSYYSYHTHSSQGTFYPKIDNNKN